AFGGRLIAEARPGQPKYWNSPETPVFSKSRTLYGLWRARKAIAVQGQAVVVEGYTDVVAAHQAGFENVVATLGTSLTEEHVRILARLAPTVLLGFDADSAGLKAAFRAAEIFEAQEVEVRVLDLPDGEDPDSLLRAGKRRVFEQAITNALPLVEYRLRRLVQKEPTETERDRVALFRKALPILASVPSMIEREQYVKLLAPYHPQFQSGAVYAEEQIRQDAAAHASGAAGRAPEARFQPAPPRPASNVVRPGNATERAERHLLRALTGDDSTLAEMVLTQIAPTEFLNAQARALASAIYAHFASAPSLEPSLLLARLEDETLRGALSALMMEQGQEPLTPLLIEGEIAHLKQRAKQERRTALGLLIKQGQASPEDQEEFRRLLTELKGTRSPHPMGAN
nr:toprim domain-containing protein [Armatimonadota bacterium]